MSVSPVILKGLAGLGAISTITAGGVWWYTRPEAQYANIDEFASSTKEGTWSWTPTNDGTLTTTSGQNTNVEITGTLTGKGNNKGKTWICKIKGIIKSSVSSPNLEIQEQFKTLKTAIGINEENTRNKSKSVEFQRFIENCIRHRETTPTNENSTSAIDLGELILDNAKYKFDTTKLRNLYESEYWTQKLKEKQLNITCTTDTSCTATKGFEPSTAGGSITITKGKEEDPERFNNGISYKISGTKDNKDGNYEIKKQNGKFKLIKVDDLFQKDLCAKVGLTCENSTTTTITPPTSWKANFYQDSNNYKKQSTISNVTNIQIEEDTGDNYYGNKKFKFTGSASLTNGDEHKGTITVEQSKGYTVKYVPDIKDYAFIKKET